MAILDVLPGVGVARDLVEGGARLAAQKGREVVDKGTQRAYTTIARATRVALFATGIVCAGIVLIVLSKSGSDDPAGPSRSR